MVDNLRDNILILAQCLAPVLHIGHVVLVQQLADAQHRAYTRCRQLGNKLLKRIAVAAEWTAERALALLSGRVSHFVYHCGIVALVAKKVTAIRYADVILTRVVVAGVATYKDRASPLALTYHSLQHLVLAALLVLMLGCLGHLLIHLRIKLLKVSLVQVIHLIPLQTPAHLALVLFLAR